MLNNIAAGVYLLEREKIQMKLFNNRTRDFS